MKDGDRKRYVSQLARAAGHRRGKRLKTLADWQAAGIPVVGSEPEREEK